MSQLTWPLACKEELKADECAVRAESSFNHVMALAGIGVSQVLFQDYLDRKVIPHPGTSSAPANIFDREIRAGGLTADVAALASGNPLSREASDRITAPGRIQAGSAPGIRRLTGCVHRVGAR